MSLRVLIIPEDPTYNGYILKPLIERMLNEIGKPKAKIQVLTDPKIGGYTHAVKAIKGKDLTDKYAHYDLWLFLPDGDCARNADGLEQDMRKTTIPFFVCPAQPEVEVWLLAGHREKLDIKWQKVRSHTLLKEAIFDPFLKRYGNPSSTGGGRGSLMRETLCNYRGLLELCPEIQKLQLQINDFLSRKYNQQVQI